MSTTDLGPNRAVEPGTDLEAVRQEHQSDLANKRLDAGLAEGNGVINPARWQMLAAIAETVSSTEFVPVGLRGSDKKVLACLLYGDALGLQPMTSLKEIHVIDGTPGLSAAAMAALVRKAHPGHRLRREELRDEEGRFLGVRAYATRGDTGETDEYEFTLAMAARAGLMGKNNWKNYPEAMCTARAFSQICTFLFPDVFMGSPYVPEEIESFTDTGTHVDAAEHVDEGHVIVKAPPAVAEPVAEGMKVDEESGAVVRDTDTEQTEWEVADAETKENITYVSAQIREQLREAAADATMRFDGVDYEIVGFEVDGATQVEKLFVRKAPPAPGKPEPGTPAAVVDETIPKVFEYVVKAQEAGNVDFIRGVLDAERAGKNRSRLTGTIEEILEKMGAVLDASDSELFHNEEETAEEVAARAARGQEEPVEGEFVPLGDGAAAPAADEPVDVELDPEIPFNSATTRAKVIRVKALCAFMEDQHPEQKAWKLEGVVASAAKQWGGHIETIDDLNEEQLEMIWKAAEQYAAEAVEFLALADVPLIQKLAGDGEQDA